MNKLVLVMIKLAAICGLISLSSAVIGDTGDDDKSPGNISWDGDKNVKPIPSVAGKEIAPKELPGLILSVYELEEGRTVPTQRLDGRGTAKMSASGAVIFGEGVYVTRDGIVRSKGKVVRRLGPGESLSMDELEVWSQKRPGSPNALARDVASSPPVGRSDISGSTNADGPAIAGAANRPDAPGGLIKPAATASPDRATRGKSRSGEDVFVLGNGTQVPADLGGGVTGTANDSGGIDYSDGRSSHVDPATGDTVFSNADGSEASRYTPATAGTGTTPDGKTTETFVMPNGNHVPREQGGGTGVPNDSGGVNYPDGSYTEYDSDSGETVFFNNQGSEIHRAGSQQAFPAQDDEGGSIFVMTNGQTVPRTGPDGQVGTPNENGGVDYDDGNSINPSEDGRSIVRGSPNGDYIAVESSTDGDGNATFDLGNGTSVPANGPGGQGEVVAGGAAVEYSDGTFVSVDAKTGETIFQYPDGSSEVMQGQNNRKDAENYVYQTSGRSSGGSSSNDSGEKKDTNENSNSGGSGDNDSDDDKGSKDKDDEDDDSSDDSSDGGDDDKGSKDDGKDSDDKDQGADKNLVAGGDAGNSPEGKTTVDDALARKTGDKKEPDSTAPPTCEEGRGGPPGGVAKPGAGQQNCVPAGLQPGEDDEDESEPAPVLNPPIGNGFKSDDLRPDDLVGQPGMEIDGISNDGRTLDDKLEDIEGVVNPGE